MFLSKIFKKKIYTEPKKDLVIMSEEDLLQNEKTIEELSNNKGELEEENVVH